MFRSVHADRVEVHLEARKILGGVAYLRSAAKAVLPSPAASLVFSVITGIRRIAIDPIGCGTLHNPQPSSLACRAYDHVALGGIIRRNRPHLHTELRLARVEIRKNIELDAVLFISLDKERSLREVRAAGIFEWNTAREFRLHHVIAAGSRFGENGHTLRIAVPSGPIV